jgi:hypothetical protein
MASEHSIAFISCNNVHCLLTVSTILQSICKSPGKQLFIVRSSNMFQFAAFFITIFWFAVGATVSFIVNDTTNIAPAVIFFCASPLVFVGGYAAASTLLLILFFNTKLLSRIQIAPNNTKNSRKSS